jgi:hypothetical protein
MIDRKTTAKVLDAIATWPESLPWSVDAQAATIGLGRSEVIDAIDFGLRVCLCFETEGFDDTEPLVESPEQKPWVSTAGRQFISHGDKFSDDDLRFAYAVDDLLARRALRIGGNEIILGFRDNLLAELGQDEDFLIPWAKALVPPAFKLAVDRPLALQLYSAAVALMSNLSRCMPAGSVAEEIFAVQMIPEAENYLDLRLEDRFTQLEAEKAKASLNGIFDLFGDSDVMFLFRMEEPADAAVASQSETSSAMGVADQRIEAWFDPFWDAARSGYGVLGQAGKS